MPLFHWSTSDFCLHFFSLVFRAVMTRVPLLPKDSTAKALGPRRRATGSDDDEATAEMTRLQRRYYGKSDKQRSLTSPHTRRQMSNRLSAARARERQRENTASLESMVKRLQQENEFLRSRLNEASYAQQKKKNIVFIVFFVVC